MSRAEMYIEINMQYGLIDVCLMCLHCIKGLEVFYNKRTLKNTVIFGYYVYDMSLQL